MTTDLNAIARPTGNGRFETKIAVAGSLILADEPAEAGGGGAGPTPYQLLAAALAACTTMTLTLYAARKGWTLPSFSVEVAHEAGGAHDRFVRQIVFAEPLAPDREARLLEIAERCPVHRTLSRGSDIVTRVGSGAAHPAAEPAARHARDMDAACRD